MMRVVLDTNIILSAPIAADLRDAELVKSNKAGRLVNQVKKLADDIHPLPRVERSANTTGDLPPAMSEGGKADYLLFPRGNSPRCLHDVGRPQGHTPSVFDVSDQCIIVRPASLPRRWNTPHRGER
jgi:hypothetical protein